MVGERVPPLLRIVDGEPLDRRRRHEIRKKEAGFVYVKVLVPADAVKQIRQAAKAIRDEDDIKHFRKAAWERPKGGKASK